MGFGSKPGLLSVRMAAANPGKKRSKSESSNSKSRSRCVVFSVHESRITNTNHDHRGELVEEVGAPAHSTSLHLLAGAPAQKLTSTVELARGLGKQVINCCDSFL